MEPEAENLQQNHPNWSKAKKTLIIVGQMGAGKSSFVKDLVADNYKASIKAKSSIHSNTSQCQLYLVQKDSPLHKQVEQGSEIWVMDTPGLDSQTSADIIIMQIQNMIITEGLEIIGIGFLMILSQMKIKSSKGQSIVDFINFFPLKWKIKQSLVFCVLSHYDEYFRKKQKIQNKSKQCQEFFKEKNLQKIWEKKIQWVSYPTEDIEDFEQELKNDELKKIYQNKELKLSKIIEKNKSHVLKFQDFFQDYNHFIKTCRSIIKEMSLKNNPQIAFHKVNQKNRVKLNKLPQSQWKKNLKRVKNSCQFSTTDIFLISSICLLGSRIIKKSIDMNLSSIKSFFLIAGLGKIAIVGIQLGVDKILKDKFKDKYEKEEIPSEEIVQEERNEVLNKLLNSFARRQVFSSLCENIVAENKSLKIKKFQKLINIEKIEKIVQSEERIPLQQLKDYEYLLEMEENQESEFQFSYNAWIIKEQALLEILREETKNFYNKE